MAIAIVMCSCALVFSRYAEWHFLKMKAVKCDDTDEDCTTVEIQASIDENWIDDKIGMGLNGRNY